MEHELIDRIVRQVVQRLEMEEHSCPPSANVGNAGKRLVPIGISVRHLHISREHLDIIYGRGYELKKRNDLYQTGEFASQEVVTLVGPSMRTLAAVRILGPMRKQTQVEISQTDAIVLGAQPPVRPSGDIAGSTPVVIVGPCGAVHLPEGMIRANRHMHLSESDAQMWGIKDNQVVRARIAGEKALVFEGVQVRVRPNFKTEMHLDTDDGNAAGVTCGTMAEIVSD